MKIKLPSQPIGLHLAMALLTMLWSTGAHAIYTADDAVHNGVTGHWDLPSDLGSCVTGIKSDGTFVKAGDATASRPDCLTNVFPELTTQAACVGDSNDHGGSHYWATSCVASDGTPISLNGLDRTGGMCELAIAAAGKTSKGWACVDSGFTSKADFAKKNACEKTDAGEVRVGYAWDDNLAKCINTMLTQEQCTGAGALAGTTTLTWTNKSMSNICTGSWVYLGAKGDGAPGFCYTTLNVTTAYKTQGTCPTTTAGYSWASNKCTYAYGIKGYVNAAIAKKDGSGNYAKAGDAVDLSALTQGQCLFNGASWSTGTTKSGTSSVATTPNPSTVATVTGVRAGCLGCHNTYSQNNAYAERWKNTYLLTGHRNMLRKVDGPWAGPDGKIYTEAAQGQTLDFTGPTVSGSFGNDKALMYIFGDWMRPAPEALDTIVDTGEGHAHYNGTGTYSCAACHTTGWGNASAGLCTDSTVTNKANCTGTDYLQRQRTWVASSGRQGSTYTPPEPLASFPNYQDGITGKWDRDGILCSRCHASTFPAVTTTTISSVNNPSDCEDLLKGSWDAPSSACKHTQLSCVWANGSWSTTSNTCSLTGTHNNTPSLTGDGVTATGPQQIVQLCFGCHQSLAKDQSQNDSKAAIPMTDLHVGNIPVWTTYRRDFNGHIIGANFLNSPHARLTGGQVFPNPLGKYDLFGGTYNSQFKGYLCRSSRTRNGGSVLSTVLKNGKVARIESREDCNLAVGFPKGDSTDYGYWQAETQGSCVTCHNVHQSVVEEVGAEEPFYRECTDCHAKNPANMNHPTGPGTPLVDLKADPSASCEICHMPRAGDLRGNENFPSHLFRINTSAAYSTFPNEAQFEQAGVCQDAQKAVVSNALTRTACTPGKCSIAGKQTRSACDAAYGTWTTDSTNAWVSTAIANTAPESYATGSFSAAVWNDLDMACGQCHGGSAGPLRTKNGAPYMDKRTLSYLAKNMHNNALPKPALTKTINGLTVTLTDTTIATWTLPKGAISIRWGDKSAPSFGDAGGTFEHTYAKAKRYTITLTVTDKSGRKARKKFAIRLKALVS